MEQSALLLLEELQNMGHQCEVQSLQEVGELGELLARRQIPASSIGYHGKWGWRSFLPLRRLLKTKQADAVIMVGHNLMATLALGNLGQGKRILTLHFHHEGMLPPWLWKVTYRAALRR
ncbi:MAG TPA: glycosyltransferase, partial [Candidatus Methylacidiphilales bacterium]